MPTGVGCLFSRLRSCQLWLSVHVVVNQDSKTEARCKIETNPAPKGPLDGAAEQQPSRPAAAAATLGARRTPPKPATRQEELRLLINSRHPIITVETPEEARVEALLLDVAAELGVPLYEWSVTTGLAKAHGAPLYNTDSPEQGLANIALIQGDGIFLLKDFARYCDNDKICRRLRDLAEKFRTARRSIVLTAAKVELPADLEGNAMPFQLGLPEAEDLLPGVRQVLAELSRDERIASRHDAAGAESGRPARGRGPARAAEERSGARKGRCGIARCRARNEARSTQNRGIDRDGAARHVIYGRGRTRAPP